MIAGRKDARQAAILPLLTPILAALAALFSLLVLAGWATNLLLITRINASYIPMAPDTALCFVILGALLLFSNFWPTRQSLKPLWQVLAALVLLFNIAILLQFMLVTFFGLSLDIEKWFGPASISNQGYLVGRMSPVTALLFILLCMSALLALAARNGNPVRRRLAQSATVLAFLLSGILIVGYLFGTPLLYGGTITPVAFTTAIVFFVISAAFLFEGTHGWFSRWITSNTVNARITRQILPGTVLIILLLAWLHTKFLGEIPPGYVTFFQAVSALFTAGFIAVITFLAARQIQATLTRADQEQRLSEDKFRNLFNNAEVGMYRTRLDGSEILDINDKFLEILGRRREELQASSFLAHWADPQEYRELVRQLETKGRVTDFECGVLNKQGEVRKCLTSVRLFPQPGILEGSIQDITERRQSQEILQARLRLGEYAATHSLPELLQQTLDEVCAITGSPIGFYDFVEPDQKTLSHQTWSTRTLQEYCRAERSDEHFDIAEAGVWVDCIRQRKAIIHNDYASLPHRKGLPAGHAALLRELVVPIFREDLIVAILGIGNRAQEYTQKDIEVVSFFADVAWEIVRHKRAEEAIQASESRFRSLFENMLNGFAYCQMLVEQDRPLDFIYLQVNRAFETLTGLKEVVGKKVSELIPGIQASDPELLERYARVAQTGLPEAFENYVEALKMWFSTSVYSPQKGYFVAVFDVITDRKLAEQELQAYSEYLEDMVNDRTRELQNAQEKMMRHERLATLGQLAGSVGHELRNPLGVISNAIYFLKMTQPDASATILEYLDIIEKETKTSNKIVTDLLDFTRIKSVDRESVQVSELLTQTLKRYPVPAAVEMQLDLPAGLPSVYADPRQAVQVLGNLVTNACQAMLEPPAGSSSLPAPAGAPQACKLTLSAHRQGDMIAIAVQDSGVGIPPENMGKLFEPLFTTKTKGIGLGLAVSQKLTEANGGHIEASSTPGQGSTFTVYLPVFSS